MQEIKKELTELECRNMLGNSYDRVVNAVKKFMKTEQIERIHNMILFYQIRAL